MPMSSPVLNLVKPFLIRPKPLTVPSAAWKKSPSSSFNLPTAICACLPNSSKAAPNPSMVAFSPILTSASAMPFMTGRSFVPMASVTSPKPFFILCVERAVADAVPLTCVSMAVRMTACASWMRLLSTRTASFAFSDSVNVMPDLRRLLTPLMGSSSAFPSWTAFCVASPKPAAAMSTAACVALSNAPPATSAVTASCLNVSSLACAALMVSAVTPVSRSSASA